MRGVLSGLLLAFTAFTASAEDYNGIPDQFFKSFFVHRYEEAFDAIIPKRKLSDEDISSVTVLLNRLRNDQTEYKYYELVSEEKVGTRYVILTYVIGSKESQAGIVIRLYKPDSEWVASTFLVNSKYTDLMKQIASGE